MKIITGSQPPSKRQPTHPGAVLKEDVLPALNLSIAEAASQFGISRQALHKVLPGTVALTPKWRAAGPVVRQRTGAVAGNAARA